MNLDDVDIFTRQGAVSASLIPGARRVIPGGSYNGHVGDAVFVDLVAGVLAVADGPDKNPTASSRFLKRFIAEVIDVCCAGDARIAVGDRFDDIVTRTNELVKKSDYHDSTTFSALIFGSDGQTILLHTGDSLVYALSSDTGEVTQLSHTNHFLIGRSPHLFQTELISLDDRSIVVLSTDGITDLARSHGLNTADFITRHVALPQDIGCPHRISARIVALVESAHSRFDDIGLVVARPAMMNTEDVNRNEGRALLMDRILSKRAG
ncbi:MAG: SpoIIE family protein phosphatase [Deltaproteobacteria bacterium]|nr:SpoIIE family protein phosphatase [Candidatus Zymogenaceae bacterium]